MKIAICDDNLEEIENLENLLIEYKNLHSCDMMLYSFNNPAKLLEQLSNDEFDLILLDILMPEFTGLELVNKFNELNIATPVIFITSSDQFALSAYNLDVKYYLLKPVDKTRLYKILDELKNSLKEDKLIIRGGKKSINIINSSDIVFVEAWNKFITYNMVDGSKIEVRGTLGDAREKLESIDCFYQAHRSVIVNFNFVEGIVDNDLVLKGGFKIHISRDKINLVENKYISYFFKDGLDE